MACPFFEPRQKLDPGPWTHIPRLPLGAAYSGVCRAGSGPEQVPSEDHQRELCNCGYARGRCSDFPAGDAADAVRFSLAGGQDTPLLVLYILEKDHAPVRHGVLELPAAGVDVELLPLQARAFVEAYLGGPKT
jgi:hypothetical protein